MCRGCFASRFDSCATFAMIYRRTCRDLPIGVGRPHEWTIQRSRGEVVSAGALMMAVVFAITIGTLVLLIMSLLRSIHNERAAHRSVWREFALGLVLMILFFATWIAHAITEWQVFTDEQSAHGEAVKFGDFIAEF